jgi:hypothetical protein
MICKKVQSKKRNSTEVQTNMSEIDFSSEIEDLANPNDELKKRIVALAGTIRKWNEETVKVRKSVRKQLKEIIDLGINERHMERSELRGLVEEIFRYYNISESWLRKLLPVELKDTSKTRISYLQKQKMDKERQNLLQQRPLESHHGIGCKLPSSSTMESISFQPLEPETTQSSSEIRQEADIDYASEYYSQDQQTQPSSRSNQSSKVQSELIEAHKKIEKLEVEVRRLSEPFVAKADLQALSEVVHIVANIDPVEKAIVWVRFDKDSGI